MTTQFLNTIFSGATISSIQKRTESMFKFLLSTIFLIASTSVSAHDFEANNNGTPIYFNLKEGGKAVEVTFRGSQPQDVINEYKGEVVIPNAITFDGTTYPVTGIGEAAFMGCTELVTIHIPSSVTSLDANAFYDCKRLTSVYYNLPAEEVTSISEEVFQNVNPMIILYVPAQSRLKFRKTIGWNSFKNIIANDNFKEDVTLAATATHPIDFTAKAEPIIIEKPGKKAKAVSKEKTSTKKEKAVKEKTSTKKEKPVVKEKPVIKKEKTISKEKPSTKKEKPVVKEEAPIKKKLTKSEKAALKMKEEKAAQQAYLKAEAEKAAKKKALKAEKAKEKARKAAEKEAAKKAEKEVAKKAEKKEKTKKSSSQTTLLVPSFMKHEEETATKTEPTTSVETPVVETPVIETPVVTTEAEPTTVQPTVPTQEEAAAVVPEPAPTPAITHPAELTALVNTMNSTLPKSLGAGVGITEEKLILEKDFLIMPYSVDEDQNPNIDALLKTLGKNFDSTDIDKLIDLRLPQNRRLVKMLAEKNYGLKYRYQASKHPDFFVEKVVKAEELKKY
ncbi:MAG: leucine-rich repeat protein [Bacteroidaceae bacterium]|nr:leucine-rich repeat protein [Bacteroidaceae bacterium]